jgi:hypothetical protein
MSRAVADLLECSLDPTSDAPRAARALLDEWSERLDDDVLQTSRLLVSELIGLSIRGADPRDTGRVTLRLELEGWRLRAEIARESGIFVFSVADDDSPDLTLGLVDQLADRWGLRRVAAGTACWFEIDC